jgi:hypothetical protein
MSIFGQTAKARRPATKKNLERDRNTERMRGVRSRGREVVIPKCADLKRRKELELDDFAWLRYYCGDLFWYEFTMQQREMIVAIGNAIRFGGDQALAASRGEGKTKISERTLLKATLCGVVSFSVLFGATGGKAQDSLASIRQVIELNPRLCEDYPEVCIPVRALENTPNRAHYQMVSGFRHDNGEPFSFAPSRFSWCGHEIILPNVPGSPAAGAIFATRGLDAEVRGLNKLDKRVEVAVIDDPDTEETVNSEEQATKLEKRIDRAIAGLGGQQKSIARVMLTTLQRRRCVSAKFTDPKEKPSWNGKRFRFLIKPPDRVDLWEEYVALRRSNQEHGDPHATESFLFYQERKEVMDAGAIVANPHRFNAELLPDGRPTELFALQRYYNEVARIGQEAVSTEFDNDPPEETRIQESGITPTRIQCQVSGYPRGQIPPGCTVLTQGIDVNKTFLHWVVRAWRPDPNGFWTGFTIAYGVTEVHGTIKSSDEGLDAALVRALHARRLEVEEQPYCFADGTPLVIQLNLIDSKWRKEAIFRFCDEAGQSWYPAIGYGRSMGTIAPNFREASSPNKVMGWQSFSAPRTDGGWLIHSNADHYKAFEHDRWMSDPRNFGGFLLYGEPGRGTRRSEMSDDEKGHMGYAHHICAEIEVEEPIRGVMKRYWKEKTKNNHWLDASYRATLAAAWCSVRLYGMPAPVLDEPVEQAPPLTMPDGSPFFVLERG